MLQEQYKYIYELAAYHLASSRQEDDKLEDGHVYANMSQL